MLAGVYGSGNLHPRGEQGDNPSHPHNGNLVVTDLEFHIFFDQVKLGTGMLQKSES